MNHAQCFGAKPWYVLEMEARIRRLVLPPPGPNRNRQLVDMGLIPEWANGPGAACLAAIRIAIANSAHS